MSLLLNKSLNQQLAKVKESLPTPKDGRDGRDGKDGVTTTVVKEVLANKEALLDKEEFEEFKNYMVRMEQDIRNSLAKTHNYFGGGGGGGIREVITNVIQVEETSTITSSQIDNTKINVVLVNQPNITVTLPTPSAEVFIIVQQGYNGDETFQVCYE
jgi:hypothetical protein